MSYLFLAIGLLAAPVGALALTWDFAEGTTYGWTAEEGVFAISESKVKSFPPSVYNEVEDGVWRIEPVPKESYALFYLRSPLIGEDSALFDRVTLRLRVIREQPIKGTFVIRWANSELRRLHNELGYRLGGSEHMLKFFTGYDQLAPIVAAVVAPVEGIVRVQHDAAGAQWCHFKRLHEWPL